MKTETTVVTTKGVGLNEALAAAEKAGTDAGLDKKSALHLRLLSEELFGILRGIAGDFSASCWTEYENKNFELHMKADVEMSDEMREQFLNASSSGKNSAAVGFMGKIKVFIADTLLSAKQALPYAMMNAASAYPSGNAGECVSIWTMAAYKEELQKHIKDQDEAHAAWDELEKSIVANIADDVKVKIIGSNVEIIVIKTF
ncbi:MAG: hypothetical protein IJV00_02295 [Clostridia bacterium]|nr:hypothetical protein [Clostridia bacterium]